MPDAGGRIAITLTLESSRIVADIASTRPTALTRIFVDQPLEVVAARLPRLYTVCATAQASACVGACEAALGRMPDPAVVATRARLVGAETLKEHLWRILLDWPHFVASLPDTEGMAAVMRLHRQLQRAFADPVTLMKFCPQPAASDRGGIASALDALSQLCAERVYGELPESWLRRVGDYAAWRQWALGCQTNAARLVADLATHRLAGLGRNPIGHLPAIHPLELAPDLCGPRADAFVCAPSWQGEPAETSPLSRQSEEPAVRTLVRLFGNGLLPRIAARLVELARLLSGLGGHGMQPDCLPRILSEQLVDGSGVSLVDAARGLLVHRVTQRNEAAHGYHLLAPTEWNFRPGGVVAAALEALPLESPEVVRCQAELVVKAIDPCVESNLGIVRAP